MSLTHLWRLIETRPSRAAVMIEWAEAAGKSMPAILPTLRPVAKPATAYPHPRRDGQTMRIVRHKNGSIVAVDRHDPYHRLNLKPEDIVIYRLDFRELRLMLCSTLDGVAIAKTPVAENCQRFQIGNWEPKKAAAFPVYLIACRNCSLLRQELLNLQASCHKPAIVLTPTRASWNSALLDLAESRKMLLVPLVEILDVVTRDGAERLTRNDAWKEYLESFAQMIKLTLPSNFRNKKPIPRRAELAEKISKIRKVLIDHIIAAKKTALFNIDNKHQIELPCTLTKTQLGHLTDLKPHNITRCFRSDKRLVELFRIANDIELVLNFTHKGYY